MNHVALIGRLTRDPELRDAGETGRKVCDLRLAVNSGPNRQATYVDVSTFDRSAEVCAEHLAKGRQVAVDGRLVYRECEAEDGSKRSKHSVIGRVEFLGSPTGSGPADQAEADKAVGEEDIPF